ncbi:MAG: tetratricopeptide repeat protein [Thermonemataceae bacterium]
MQKVTQIVLVVVGILVVTGLYFLPKVVVDNEQTTTNSTLQESSELTEQTEEAHARVLTTAQKEVLTHWKEKLASTTEKEDKILILDSLATFFTNINWLDSASTYKDQIAVLSPSVYTWMSAGDSYYDAFSFAMNSERANLFGNKARAYYEKVLAEDPENWDAKTKMGMTYVTTKNPMKGISMLLEVVEKDPDNELALYNLGILSMERGAPDKAVQRFEALLEVNPNNAQAWVLLAQSYQALENTEKAISALESVQKLDLDSITQQQVALYLEELKKN